MILKHCLKNKFYLFNPEDFSFKKVSKLENYEGKLFNIGQSKVVLWSRDYTLLLRTKEKIIDVKDCTFSYYESKLFSYLSIGCGVEKITLKHSKSIWELLNISTYDYLEKIEDNDLYYLYDIIREFKNLRTSSEIEKFILEF